MITVDLNEVLREWSYRTTKGYPIIGDPADMNVLDDVLLEMYGVPYSELFTEAPKPTKKAKAPKVVIDPIAGYPKNLLTALTKLKKIDIFREFVDSLPEGTSGNTARTMLQGSINAMCKSNVVAVELAKVFKSKNTLGELDSVSFGEGINNSLFKIQPAGIGPGELLIGWLVLGAVVQGPSKSFDIEVGGQHFEVKSLQDADGGKSTSIDTAKYGKISSHKLTPRFQGFWEYILKPYYDNKLRDSVISITDDPKSQSKITAVLDKLETVPRNTLVNQDPIESSGEITPKIFDLFYNAVSDIHSMLPKSIKDKVASSRIAVKSKSTDAQYWIDAEDADDITKNAGKDTEISIKVGDKITDENKSAKIWFSRLINNEFIRNPKSFIDALVAIRDGFSVGKAGLIYFDNNKVNISLGMHDFFVVGITRSSYRIDLKSRKKYQKFNYQKDQ